MAPARGAWPFPDAAAVEKTAERPREAAAMACPGMKRRGSDVPLAVRPAMAAVGVLLLALLRDNGVGRWKAGGCDEWSMRTFRTKRCGLLNRRDARWSRSTTTMGVMGR